MTEAVQSSEVPGYALPVTPLKQIAQPQYEIINCQLLEHTGIGYHIQEGNKVTLHFVHILIITAFITNTTRNPMVNFVLM